MSIFSKKTHNSFSSYKQKPTPEEYKSPSLLFYASGNFGYDHTNNSMNSNLKHVPDDFKEPLQKSSSIKNLTQGLSAEKAIAHTKTKTELKLKKRQEVLTKLKILEEKLVASESKAKAEKNRAESEKNREKAERARADDFEAKYNELKRKLETLSENPATNEQNDLEINKQNKKQKLNVENT